MVFVYRLEEEGTNAEENSAGKALRPGPVMVCGPPGTEPVEGHSQTRFDKEESLVYSRVSLDMSIIPGYIHKSGSLKSIPPKDMPSVTAEIFARPWSKKRYDRFIVMFWCGCSSNVHCYSSEILQIVLT